MDNVIYIHAHEYLAQFIAHSYGSPAELIRDSPESRILREYLIKKPDGIEDKYPDEGKVQVAVRIPYFKEKDPRVYNHLTDSAKQVLVDSFEEILKRSMFQEIGALGSVNCKLSNLIYAWMEKHGIEEQHWYTISQKWYRLRKKYREEKGVSI